MLHVIATIELNSGKREAFLEEFHRIVPLVRGERGCLQYGPAVDAATDITNQSLVGEDVVTIIERWEDVESLKAHLQAPHMLEYRPRVKEMIRSSRLQILEPA